DGLRRGDGSLVSLCPAGFSWLERDRATKGDRIWSHQAVPSPCDVARALELDRLRACETSHPPADPRPRDAGNGNESRGLSADTSPQTAERQPPWLADRRERFADAPDFQSGREPQSPCPG